MIESVRWKKLGGPCGLCSLVCVVLTGSGAVGEHGLSAILAWYVIASGVAYTGRLPIHVFWGGYVCLRPGRSRRPELRRKLNLLTLANFAMALVWLGLGLLFLTGPALVLPLKWGVTIVLYFLVVWLAAETVHCTSELRLRRGTEIVCNSRVGAKFKALLPRVPKDSHAGRVMKWFSEPSPRHQASSFLLLTAAALIAVPSGASSAATIGKGIGGLTQGGDRRRSGDIGCGRDRAGGRGGPRLGWQRRRLLATSHLRRPLPGRSGARRAGSQSPR